MTQPINESIARNTAYQCKAESCTNKRYLISGYCKHHTKRANLYGNPLGSVLRRKTYLIEFEEVSDLIHSNLNHSATITAINFIQNWVDAANEGSPCVRPVDISRLSKVVTALDILIEATSIFLYSQRHPHALPDTKELSYQMGIGVLRLCPQPKYINVKGSTSHKKASGAQCKDVGQYLRDSLGLYFYNVINTINRQLDLDKEFRESLFTPLDMTNKVIYVEGRKLLTKTPTHIHHN